MKNIAYIILTVTLLGLAACKSQDGIYEEFLVPNGLVYPVPAQNAVSKPGNERIEIAWDRGVDPKITKARIFWNNYTDSVEVAVARDVDVVSSLISPIRENTYSFMIHTYDAVGNISIPIEVQGKVYGEIYRSTLSNRVLKSTLFDGLDLNMNWFVPDVTEVGINISYTDIDGKTRTYVVDPSETETILLDFDVNKPLFYSTEFLPDTLAIDKFSASTIETKINPFLEIPKSSWAQYNLPGDIGAILAMPGMWNGNSTGNGFHSSENIPLPCAFSWDMGLMAKLTRMKVWPRGNVDDRWRRGHPKEFEIYGSLEPNPDGSLDNSWTLLGRFEIVNPHPEIEEPWNDPAMIAIADAGFEFEFISEELVDATPAVRYIRFNALSNYSDSQQSPISIAEITFWGKLAKVRE